MARDRSPRAWDGAIKARRERQRAEREERIAQLVDSAQRCKGAPTDLAYWSLVYDLELAPMTSNRKQLAELNVTVPAAESLEDAELVERLWQIIDALADLNTFLLHTDHLSDRQLYERLDVGVLDEPVHEIFEGSGGREFIDLCGGGGPGDRETWLQFYASDEERAEALPAGSELPPRCACPFDRDRTLPRPE